VGLSGFEWNTPISIAAWTMGLAQIPFIINFFWSMKRGEKWTSIRGTRRRWNGPRLRRRRTEISRPRRQFIAALRYSLPGRENDFTMQTEPLTDSDRKAYEAARLPECTNASWKFLTP